MNTADRSIALLDTALRRRFGFIELMPDVSVLGDVVIEKSIPLGLWLNALNARICEFIGRDARNLQIGHAYFLENGRPVEKFSKLSRILQDDIIPLIQEYCYEDYETIAKILGKNLIDENKQRVLTELFDPARQDELIQALKSIAPELDSSATVIQSEAETPEEEAIDESEENSEKIEQ
jgi:5-methylcytosine-specific restriction protein B